jgi:hypothetical protein
MDDLTPAIHSHAGIAFNETQFRSAAAGSHCGKRLPGLPRRLAPMREPDKRSQCDNCGDDVDSAVGAHAVPLLVGAATVVATVALFGKRYEVFEAPEPAP